MQKPAHHDTAITASTNRRANAAHALRLYLVGQGLVLVGAWSIEASGSMLPMALASLAALLLTLPLVSHLWRARRH